MSGADEFGDTWVYESIVGAVPGLDLRSRTAVALQFALFQGGLLVLAWAYDLWSAAVPGTVAVAVAAAGSVAMLHLGSRTRALDPPEPVRRLLFGSSIEVVLSVLAFVALVTYLLADGGTGGAALFTDLFGPDPPVLPVYLTLLVLWDLCYRIGTSWWIAVVSLWRSVHFRFEAQTAAQYRRIDAANVGFGLLQLALVPFVRDEPILLVAVVGHVLAVTVVSTAAYVLAGRG
ncbi:MAG: hypothetical protein ABEJ22_06310 [Haloferacaceae archaeon]